MATPTNSEGTVARENTQLEPPFPTNHEEQQQANGVQSESRGQLDGTQAEKKPNSGRPHHRATEMKEKLAEQKDKITDKKERLKDKTSPPGGYDSTPLPDIPPGYTVRFTFHKAANLPAADYHSGTSDPYVKATLTTGMPTRHKVDPVLCHRTRTIHRTREPEWEEEWIVANVPASGFKLKCRLYDEDSADHDDRLGNVTYTTSRVDENWKKIDRQVFNVEKRVGSKRAYFFKAAASALTKGASMTPHFEMSIEVLGRSDPPGGHMYTVGPTTWIKHYSPTIGRLAGTKVNKDERHDHTAAEGSQQKQAQKYDFQANEIQLQGPVSPKLYHRYVEFRPIIGRMFSSHGLRGRILHMALHKQHNRVYNYNRSTEYGFFEPCSKDAASQFLKMAHFDEGGRIFTYVLTLDATLRFTETGKEFGIDLLSKHTMHSDVETYVACAGEFFIRRLAKPTGTEDPEPDLPTHPAQDLPGGPPEKPPPEDPSYYQLIIDNDSGTYRPDKSILPDLKEFLERNFPGLGIVVMHCADKELDKLKKNQLEIKKREGKGLTMVMNRSPSSSSLSSSDEERLEEIERHAHGAAKKSKREKAWDVLEDPNRIKDLARSPGASNGHAAAAGESSVQAS